MTFTAASKVGQILQDPGAAEVFLAALPPEIADSQYLPMLGSRSLQDLAEMMDRDQAWLDRLVAALVDVPALPERDHEIRPSDDYESEDTARGSARFTAATGTPRWAIDEITFSGPSHGNPFTDVDLGATFTHGGRTVSVPGFYDGDGTYRIRFMPDVEGSWAFRTRSNARSLDGIEGLLTCGPPEPGRHGPVRVAGTFHFAHADGTPYRPIGTTCYAWTHQTDDLERRTLASLAASPFNKIRMCVFPKSYLFNENEPERHAFARLDDGSFDPRPIRCARSAFGRVVGSEDGRDPVALGSRDP